MKGPSFSFAVTKKERGGQAFDKVPTIPLGPYVMLANPLPVILLTVLLATQIDLA